MKKRTALGAAALITGLSFGLLFAMPASAQDADQAHYELGKETWVNGGCQGCHGNRGQGGAGGDQPAGPSLRSDALDRDGLLEAIICGRAGTQMPAWLDGAYTEHACYDIPLGTVPERTVVVGAFSLEEIEALADYIITEFRPKAQ